MPEFRTITRKEGEPNVELYVFPGNKDNNIVRYATIGVSQQSVLKKKNELHELMIALPKNIGGAGTKEVEDYILDLMAYSVSNDTNFTSEMVIPSIRRVPLIWRQNAVLVDEPSAEAEELQSFSIGKENIRLLWLLPIYSSEAEKIKQEGLEWFDEKIEESELSVIDLARDSFA